MPVCRKCTKKFPNLLLIDGKKRNVQNRQFCIECSPFLAHNTKSYLTTDSQPQYKECVVCKQIKNKQ